MLFVQDPDEQNDHSNTSIVILLKQIDKLVRNFNLKLREIKIALPLTFSLIKNNILDFSRKSQLIQIECSRRKNR